MVSAHWFRNTLLEVLIPQALLVLDVLVFFLHIKPPFKIISNNCNAVMLKQRT